MPLKALEGIHRILLDFTQRGIRFCHWKSNIRLPNALRGETDLDLLFDEHDEAKVFEVIRHHELKEMSSPPGGDQPGMFHFLGMDRVTARLFHIHGHFRLVIGQRGVKNYRLPIESKVLASVRELHGVPTPSPSLELGILAVRTLLKYRLRDGVKDLLGIRSPGVQSEASEEIEWLMSQASIEEAAAALDPVPEDDIRVFLVRLRANPRAGFLEARRRMRKVLRGHARMSWWEAAPHRLREIVFRRHRYRRVPYDRGMRLAGRGIRIGVIGADGAGKTTLVDELEQWLGWKLSVRTYYLGSKQPSHWTRVAYLGFRALRRLHRSVAKPGLDSVPAVRLLAVLRDGLLGVHYLWVGHDRLKRYEASGRDVEGGQVVIFDRFPVPSVSGQAHHRLLDGPQIRDRLGSSAGWIARRLADREEKLYDSFAPPDLLLVLDVDPSVSVARKPDHVKAILVEKRRGAREIADAIEAGYPDVRVVRLNANRPLEEVHHDAKLAVWDAI